MGGTAELGGSVEMKLDDLLGATEPHGTFHDAAMVDLHVDYRARTWRARFELCVGDPDARTKPDRERRRQGCVELQGLFFWALDPPAAGVPSRGSEPWLTSDGLLSEAPTETAARLAKQVPRQAVAWYLYFADLNAFGYCAAERASFRWL